MTATTLSAKPDLMPASAAGTFAQKAALANNLAGALGRISSEIMETIQFVSAQRTRRAEIRAEAEKLLAKLRAETEVIRLALEQDFEQRQEVLRHLFKNLDNAVASHAPHEIIHAILQGILELARTSSLQDLTNFLVNTDPTRTLRLEF